MQKQTLDFIVIGAQKSGTTTLFEHMAKHPELRLPSSKEAPFFMSDRKYGGDWNRFLQTEFGSADQSCQWGTVTPQYMYGGSGQQRPADVRSTPWRIHERLPAVRLIAILRDPMERARSHHAMALIEGWDERPFAQAIRELLAPEALAKSRDELHETTGYVVFGEYGRILSGYLDVFGPEQLMVLFSSELNKDPQAVLRRVFEFIGVDADFVPEGLGKHYHETGAAPRMKWLDLYRWQVDAAHSPALRGAWHALPESSRRWIDARYRKVNYRVRVWNRGGWGRRGTTRKPERDPEPDRLLAEHFKTDAALLRQLFGVTPPWTSRLNTLTEPAQATGTEVGAHEVTADSPA